MGAEEFDEAGWPWSRWFRVGGLKGLQAGLEISKIEKTSSQEHMNPYFKEDFHATTAL